MKKDNKKKKANVENKREDMSKKNNKLYFGFGARLFLFVLMFFAFLMASIKFSVMSFNFVEPKAINYSEKSNLDYKVYLKENEFYDKEYLDKNMLYVASLIDKIKVDFDYNFMSEENVDLNLDYKVIGKLSITDSSGTNIYLEKQYMLLDTKSIKMQEVNKQAFKDSIDIDYDYYNSLATKFKTSYGVDTASKLIVYIMVDKHNDENIVFSNSSMMSVTIPLSESAVNIGMDYQEINNTNKILGESNLILNNIFYLVLAVIFIILSLVTAVKFIRLLYLLRDNKSVYDKYVGKLLLEYDRLIVETTTFPALTSDNVIHVNKFQELLDVRDNLKLPIMYYLVSKHQKCYFYIMHDGKVYLNVVKAVDLEENDKQ